jgi:hypothetical protein
MEIIIIIVFFFFFWHSPPLGYALSLPWASFVFLYRVSSFGAFIKTNLV